ASLAVAPCLGWAVDSRASWPFDDRAVGPAGDPRTTAIDAGAFWKSQADAHAAPTSFAKGLPVAEAAASVDMATPVTAVPEPQAYVLMLVGLSAVAFIVRRRRRLD
ncbi:MAG TPA: PEP-CTERM sorting domain-containing protein, partial [Burkholderiaceae bacterium]|nr:PEP-CTERM sorting domain-containing protein [Burkholderiaceae bacterium]